MKTVIKNLEKRLKVKLKRKNKITKYKRADGQLITHLLFNFTKGVFNVSKF